MIERITTAKNTLITSAETASRFLRFVFSLGKVFASACKPKRIAGEKVKPKEKGISRLLTKAAIAIAGVSWWVLGFLEAFSFSVFGLFFPESFTFGLVFYSAWFLVSYSFGAPFFDTSFSIVVFEPYHSKKPGRNQDKNKSADLI